MCDRVAIIRQGRLVALEDIPTLLARRKRNVEIRLAGPPPALDGRRRRLRRRVARRPADVPARGRRRPVPGRHRGAPRSRPDDRAGAPRGGVPGVLRRDRRPRPPAIAGMNGALFLHTWRAYRVRLLIVTVALLVWGSFLPVIFDSFGSQFQQMLDSGLIPTQFAQFGGGDIFSLTGLGRARVRPPDRGRAQPRLRGRVLRGGGRRRAAARHARDRCCRDRSRGAGSTPRWPSRAPCSSASRSPAFLARRGPRVRR